MTTDERFAQYVRPAPTGCVQWTGSLNRTGYGQFGYVRGGKRVNSAHRYAYEARYGLIPDGLTVDHMCNVRCCVNPDHMRIVRQRENTLRGAGVTSRFARAEACVNGHPFDEANTGTRRTGGRYCRACGRERERIRRSRGD